MTRSDPTAANKVKPLAQQQTDFTAEGSPAPGQVATAAPVTPAPAAKAAARKSRGPARAAGTRNGPVPRRAYPK